MGDPVVQGITSGLASAATVFVLSYLLKSVKGQARKEGETSVVEYGRPMKLLVVFFWLLVAIGGIAALFAPKEDRWIAATVMGSFFCLVLILHLEFFRVRIAYDEGGIRAQSPWRSARVIGWEEITAVTFSKAMQWFVISTRNQGALRLHLYLSGIPSLLDELKSRGLNVPPMPVIASQRS